MLAIRTSYTPEERTSIWLQMKEVKARLGLSREALCNHIKDTVLDEINRGSAVKDDFGNKIDVNPNDISAVGLDKFIRSDRSPTRSSKAIVLCHLYCQIRRSGSPLSHRHRHVVTEQAQRKTEIVRQWTPRVDEELAAKIAEKFTGSFCLETHPDLNLTVGHFKKVDQVNGAVFGHSRMLIAHNDLISEITINEFEYHRLRKSLLERYSFPPPRHTHLLHVCPEYATWERDQIVERPRGTKRYIAFVVFHTVLNTDGDVTVGSGRYDGRYDIEKDQLGWPPCEFDEENYGFRPFEIGSDQALSGAKRSSSNTHPIMFWRRFRNNHEEIESIFDFYGWNMISIYT